MRRTLIVLTLLLSGCAKDAGWDQLAVAHKRLAPAPCAAAPAVAGIAGVNTDPHEVYLGDWVVISVCRLDDLMRAAAAEQQPMTLFINGIDTGNEPHGIDRDHGVLTFILDRNEKNRDLWQPLLYAPLFDRTATIYASAGIRGNRPLPRVEGANMLLRLNKLYVDWTSYLWLALIVLVLWLLLTLARRSDMLREGPALAGVRRPYSLARSQMAWWFFLVFASYVFIWLVTGDRDTIPVSLLGMLGISAVTAIAAVAISPAAEPLARRRELYDAEIASLDRGIQQLAIDLGEAAMRTDVHAARFRTALEAKLAALEARRTDLAIARAEQSEWTSAGWWRDLVSDERGAVALDRLQVVVWSVVMGGIFVSSVMWELTMPEFSATMLALMGISAGTYIGFKLPGR
jgi:hypothetical protein